ncbi:hypothetical protein Sango_2707600 [Sesamum angolense]|uniref:Retrotransposon gag domain-containing protein n=1 Tax=Sesamum angolense TaxID=2727404 RepID=A0AAE2BHT3_9LAMI|nr:hypothetical protein Sango_2707600 [Sesamum angolense]
MNKPIEDGVAGETPSDTTQALQVISSTPFTPLSGSTTTATPRPTDLATDTPRIIISPDAPPVELSLDFLGAIQQMIALAISELLVALVAARVTTPSKVTAPEQADPALAIPKPNNAEGPSTQLSTQVMEAPTEEQVSIPFTEGVMTDELPMNYNTPAIAEYDGTTDPQEHLSHFENAALLHRYTDDINSRKHRKTELSLFSIRQKEGEPLKEYHQRFNTVALEVPSVTQEVKVSAFAQGLLDGDFFKSLAKKATTKFDALLARATKNINMEEAQSSKREGRGEKRKENKDECPSKTSKTDFKDKKPAWQRVNTMYTPPTVPITHALMALEGKDLLSSPCTKMDLNIPSPTSFVDFIMTTGIQLKNAGT